MAALNPPDIARVAIRAALTVVVALFLTASAALFCFVAVGFPPWLFHWCVETLCGGNITVDARAARLDLSRGIVLDYARFYRKKVIGPAVAEARQAVLTIHPFAAGRRDAARWSVKLVDGVIRPDAARVAGDAGALSDSETRGEITLSRCLVYGVRIESFSCEYAAQNALRKYDDIEAVLRNGDMTGRLTGSIAYDAAARLLTGRLITELDPRILLPLLEAKQMPAMAEIATQFDFSGSAPRCDVAFKRLCGEEGALYVETDFSIRDCGYRGVRVTRADGTTSVVFSGTNRSVTVKPLLVFRDEGFVRGGFTVHTDRHLVEFEAVSTIMPEALMRMIWLPTNKATATVRFDGPAKIAGRGVAGYRDAVANTDFEAAVEGADINLRNLAARKCSFLMRMSGVTNTLSDIHGTIYGGELAGGASFVAPNRSDTNIMFTADVKLDKVDFVEFARALLGDGMKHYEGELSGNLEIGGPLDGADKTSIRGEGSVQIKEGRIFLLPVFGGLSKAMARIIPGLDFVLRQSDARADFVVADGKIHSDKISIEGDILSLTGSGDYYFDGRLDFETHVTLLKEHTFGGKLIRAIAYPVSKLFQFRLTDTLDDPHWYPVNFSKELLEKLTGKEE